jgi:hypothetical protein
VLTLFGVVWGTASVVFLVSWGLGVRAMMEEAYARVGRNLLQVFAGYVGEEYTPAADRRISFFAAATRGLDGLARLVAAARAVLRTVASATTSCWSGVCTDWAAPACTTAVEPLASGTTRSADATPTHTRLLRIRGKCCRVGGARQGSAASRLPFS